MCNRRLELLKRLWSNDSYKKVLSMCWPEAKKMIVGKMVNVHW